MTKIGQQNFASKEILAQLQDIHTQAKRMTGESSANSAGGKGSFLEHLKDGLNDVSTSIKDADKMATDLASGKNQNIHETMLAATQAELNFNLMVQVRNKVLEAYQEVMRMQI